jgi:hypothetical protein
LDSDWALPHNRITSRPALQQVPAKLMFACSPCSGMANLLTLLFSTNILIHAARHRAGSVFIVALFAFTRAKSRTGDLSL